MRLSMYHHLYGVTAPAAAAVAFFDKKKQPTTTANIKMDRIDGILHILRCEY